MIYIRLHIRPVWFVQSNFKNHETIFALRDSQKSHDKTA